VQSYADVGGLSEQIQEIKESVELPLTHPELYEEVGIKPPKVFSVNYYYIAIRFFVGR
jgi:26S proteasome regulatory subunit T2